MENVRDQWQFVTPDRYRNTSCNHRSGVYGSINCNNKYSQEHSMPSVRGSGSDDDMYSTYPASSYRSSYPNSSQYSQYEDVKPVVNQCPKVCRIILPPQPQPGPFDDLKRKDFFNCIGNMLTAIALLLFFMSMTQYFATPEGAKHHTLEPVEPAKKVNKTRYMKVTDEDYEDVHVNIMVTEQAIEEVKNIKLQTEEIQVIKEVPKKQEIFIATKETTVKEVPKIPEPPPKVNLFVTEEINVPPPKKAVTKALEPPLKFESIEEKKVTRVPKIEIFMLEESTPVKEEPPPTVEIFETEERTITPPPMKEFIVMEENKLEILEPPPAKETYVYNSNEVTQKRVVELSQETRTEIPEQHKGEYGRYEEIQKFKTRKDPSKEIPKESHKVVPEIPAKKVPKKQENYLRDCKYGFGADFTPGMSWLKYFFFGESDLTSPHDQ